MSQKMRIEDWLPQAKRLPIGQTKRIYHGNETRPNLSIRNLGDKYTAYCFECKAGGVVSKAHVILDVLHHEKVMQFPADARYVWDLDQYKQKEIAAFLSTKNIDINMCFDQYMMHSEKDRRLLFRTTKGWLGRALNGAEPKWISYGAKVSYGLHPSYAVPFYADAVVFTEDYLSTLKIRWVQGAKPIAINITPVAVLGTVINIALLHEIIAASKLNPNLKLFGFFDGDQWGDAASDRAAKRLTGLGLPYQCIKAPPGKDPKDLHAADLHNLIRDAYYGVANTSGAT